MTLIGTRIHDVRALAGGSIENVLVAAIEIIALAAP
jgi:hypothetical protein